MDAPLKIVDSQDMEAPIRELDQSQAEAVVFLGKVGLGISSEHLQAPEQYKKILEYIEKHNMQITGFSREITLIDYGFTNDPEKFVFRSSHICGMSVVWNF
jgi:effector-binding domain-containing protein